ncbi:MAG: hypothetical protein AAF514_11340, partial [Verrucomicrobiota bacterium]
FGEGCKIREVADRLGLTTAAAEKRIARALEKLRGRLVRRGVVPSAVALGTLLAQSRVEAASPTLAASVAQTASAAIGAGGTTLTSQLLVMTAAKSLTLGLVAGLMCGGTLVAWSSSRSQPSTTRLPEESADIPPTAVVPRMIRSESRWRIPAPAADADAIFGQVQRLLAEPDNEIARQRMKGLLAAMPATHYQALLAMVGADLKKWWQRGRVLPELARAWAAKNPVGALSGLANSPHLEEWRRTRVVADAYQVWHTANPASAQSWLVENQDGKVYAEPLGAMVRIVAKSLAENSADEVIAWATALEGDSVKEAALAALWTEFTEDHHQAEHDEALDRLLGRFEAIKDPELSQFALQRLVKNWAETRYPELDDWLKTQPPGPAAYEAALAATHVGDIMKNDGFSKSGGGLNHQQRLANAERVLILAGDRPESEVVAEIIGGLEEVPRQMRDWALPKLTGPERDRTIIAAANLAMETGMIGDYPAPRNALDWVVHHSDPAKREELISIFYRRWMSQSSRYKGAETFPDESGWSEELKAVLHRTAAEFEER